MTDDSPLDTGACQCCGAVPENGEDWVVDGPEGDRRRVFTTLTKTTVVLDPDGIPASDRTEAFVVCGKCWDERLVGWFATLGVRPLDAGEAT